MWLRGCSLRNCGAPNEVLVDFYSIVHGQMLMPLHDAPGRRVPMIGLLQSILMLGATCCCVFAVDFAAAGSFRLGRNKLRPPIYCLLLNDMSALRFIMQIAEEPPSGGS